MKFAFYYYYKIGYIITQFYKSHKKYIFNIFMLNIKKKEKEEYRKQRKGLFSFRKKILT